MIDTASYIFPFACSSPRDRSQIRSRNDQARSYRFAGTIRNIVRPLKLSKIDKTRAGEGATKRSAIGKARSVLTDIIKCANYFQRGAKISQGRRTRRYFSPVSSRAPSSRARCPKSSQLFVVEPPESPPYRHRRLFARKLVRWHRCLQAESGIASFPDIGTRIRRTDSTFAHRYTD